MRWTLFFLMAVTLSLATPAHAQKLPPAIVAVLDYQMVLRDAAAAANIRQQIEAYRKSYQDEIVLEEEKLRREEQELKRQRAILTPDSFEQRRTAFERKVIDVQRRVQDRTRQLDRVFDQAVNELRRALVPIVGELTAEQGFNIVVDKSQVLFASRGLDITQVVIKILNERVPHVDVPKPAE